MELMFFMKNDIFKVYFWITLFLLSGKTVAQDSYRHYHTFPAYAELMFERFNVISKIPSNFVDQKNSEILRIMPSAPSAAYVYSPIVQSKDKECIIFHPIHPVYMSDIDVRVSKAVQAINKVISTNTVNTQRAVTNENLSRNNILFEIATDLGVSKDSLDIDNYLTVIAGQEPTTGSMPTRYSSTISHCINHIKRNIHIAKV